MRRPRALRGSLAALISTAARSRRLWRWAFRLAILAVVFPVLLQWILAYVVRGDSRLLPIELLAARNLLIVTAHPDDECLFFAPSILGVLDRRDHEGRQQVKGALISMSTGNNYGIGELRKKELEGSCVSLGIDASRCLALDHPDLQDDPRLWWNTSLIASIVNGYVKMWDIDAIITFDEGGVSGHINHRAVSAAVNEYVTKESSAPPAYMVRTTALIRKYTILGDLPLTAFPFTWRILSALTYSFKPTDAVASLGTQSHGSSLSRSGLVANTWQRYVKTRVAFRHHNSQFVWDRHLYLILSRYVWFNDLSRAEPAPTKALHR